MPQSTQHIDQKYTACGNLFKLTLQHDRYYGHEILIHKYSTLHQNHPVICKYICNYLIDYLPPDPLTFFVHNKLSFFNIYSVDFSFIDTPFNIDQFAKMITIIDKPSSYFQDLPKYIVRYNKSHKKSNIDIHWFNSSTSPSKI